MLDEGYNVIGVFTHDTDPHEAHWFKTPESLAKENFIPVFKPETLKTEKWYRKVKYMQPDLILSLYYRNIIPEEIFSQAKLARTTCTAPTCPPTAARAPLNWAIINGESYGGVSLHVLEKKFDTGAVVDQEKSRFRRKRICRRHSAAHFRRRPTRLHPFARIATRRQPENRPARLVESLVFRQTHPRRRTHRLLENRPRSLQPNTRREQAFPRGIHRNRRTEDRHLASENRRTCKRNPCGNCRLAQST